MRRKMIKFSREKGFKGYALKIVFTLVLSMFLFSCGGAGVNNDQGVIVTHLGYFADFPDDACGNLPAGLAGASLQLGSAGPEAGGLVSPIFAIIGIQNNLAAETFTVRRVHLRFEIVGSSVQPPSTSTEVSAILFPGESKPIDPIGEPDSSLPGSLGGNSQFACSRAFISTPLVPSDIFEWMLFHKSQLPETPFTLIVTTSVEGVTSAGDVISTNEAAIFIEVTSGVVIPPSGGGSSTTTTSG